MARGRLHAAVPHSSTNTVIDLSSSGALVQVQTFSVNFKPSAGQGRANMRQRAQTSCHEQIMVMGRLVE